LWEQLEIGSLETGRSEELDLSARAPHDKSRLAAIATINRVFIAVTSQSRRSGKYLV
jgi:hypothetical protein